MNILNLYAGLGGNRKKWSGHQVTAVEHNAKLCEYYKTQFPSDIVVCGDAHEYLRVNFRSYDFIWASPPCQSHSRLMSLNHYKTGSRRFVDLSLYQEIIFLSNFFKDRKWVVENVDPYYGELIPARVLGRHLYWSNFHISRFNMPELGDMTYAKISEMVEWLGLEFSGIKGMRGDQLLRNCVHPDQGLHILNCAIDTAYASQGQLF